jgi:RNA polymerase sigma-70 factor (ECF subfamily)
MSALDQAIETVQVLHAPVPFEVFYREQLPRVTALCLAVTRRPWVAEDLAQEAFLRAYRRWDTVGSYDRPDMWIRRVALNLTASWGRRLQAETRALLRMRARSASLPDGSSPPDREFWESVRALPRRQAQVLALYYLEDRPVDEIGSLLQLAPGTVRVHLVRGRHNLATRLGVKDGEPS